MQSRFVLWGLSALAGMAIGCGQPGEDAGPELRQDAGTERGEDSGPERREDAGPAEVVFTVIVEGDGEGIVRSVDPDILDGAQIACRSGIAVLPFLSQERRPLRRDRGNAGQTPRMIPALIPLQRRRMDW